MVAEQKSNPKHCWETIPRGKAKSFALKSFVKMQSFRKTSVSMN
jgi:hypothetical protein